MKEAIKKIIFTVFSFRPHTLSGRASILMYHSVGNNDAFFTVTSENFERQLAEIKARKLQAVKLGELTNLLKEGKDISNTIVLTFDDGYQDNLETVLPLLEKYGIPASFFIATGFIGKELIVSNSVVLPIMSEEEIKRLWAHPLVEVLPHGHLHQKMSHLSVEEAIADAERSFQELSGIIGSARRILAYPKGKHSPVLADALKRAGWEAAVTVNPGLVNSRSDHLRLPRNSVDSSVSMNEFAIKISTAIETYTWFKSLI
jgi:biofilm PGA synthesis lipoprotein PgaB